MSAIVIKTGPNTYDESDCSAVMEICDNLGNCCKTSTEGQGIFVKQTNKQSKTKQNKAKETYWKLPNLN